MSSVTHDLGKHDPPFAIRPPLLFYTLPSLPLGEMATIFICYRREDSSPSAGRLYDRLVDHFGREQIFMDVDGIRPGEDFVERIEQMVESCNAMLVVIGSRWLSSMKAAARAGSRNRQDYVHLEIAAAFRRKKRVLPILVAGAEMPAEEDLPKDIKQLGRLQAVELNDRSFSQSLAPLLSVLQDHSTNRPSSSLDVSRTDTRVVERPINLSFDGAVEGSFPHGWFNSVGFVPDVSPDYRVSVVPRTDAAGSCLRLEKEWALPHEFGSVMQRFPAEMLGGRTVKFEGNVRTEAVNAWTGLWLRADGRETPDLFFDNMEAQKISGTTDWQKYSLECRLPPETAWLNIGVVLVGVGTVWVDNLRFLVWSKTGSWADL